MSSVNCSKYLPDCDEKCIFVDPYKYICVPDSIVRFCADGRPYFFIILIVWCAPSIIAGILSLTMKVRPRIFTFLIDIVFSICSGALIGTIICGAYISFYSDVDSAIFITYCSVFPFMWIFSSVRVTICCCKSQKNRYDSFIDAPIVSQQECENQIRKSVQNPPHIMILAKATVRGGGLQNAFENVEYKTWEGNDFSITLPRNSLFKLSMEYNFNLDLDLQQIMGKTELRLRNNIESSLVSFNSIKPEHESSSLFQQFPEEQITPADPFMEFTSFVPVSSSDPVINALQNQINQLEKLIMFEHNRNLQAQASPNLPTLEYEQIKDLQFDEVFTVDGTSPEILVCTMHDIPGFVKFARSLCGGFVRALLVCFGWGTVFEYAYCYYWNKEVKCQVSKRVSSSDNLRVPYLESDSQIPISIHFE